MLFVSELGGDQLCGSDRAAGVPGNEGVHREPGRKGGRRHPPSLLPLRGRKRSQGNLLQLFTLALTV